MEFKALSMIVCLFVTLYFGLSLAEVPALFAFGDSLVDCGNNNRLATDSRANHPPYGMSFIDRVPTGRFSNGRLVVDLIASKLGLPYPPASVEAKDNILQGVNFASAGSGILDETSYLHGEVWSFTTQVSRFEAASQQLTARLGSAAASELISKSIFYICTGNNDVNNYYGLRGRRVSTTTFRPTQERILTAFSSQIQRLYALGARKFVIAGLSAVGCIPINQVYGRCSASAQSIASSYNRALDDLLDDLRANLNGTQILRTNLFGLMSTVKQNPRAYGFRDATLGCCPLYRASVFCTAATPHCSNPSDYVFFDGVHQSQSFNELAASTWWSGSSNDVYPANISTLVAL